MKPIQLTMKNFGTFKNETIDFTQLNPMFLIKGKTGSGKSTIFDAMTFALYGLYSGNRKKLKQEDMRSDFIKIGEDSYVEFTFSVDKSLDSNNKNIQKYKIKRTLPTEYITNRGTTSVHGSEMEMNIEENGDWLPVKGRTVEQYTEMIEKEIIGLKYDEFNQIVLLPQGEFSKFLRESSKDRDETLKKIFPVELIETATEKIKAKAKNYSEKLKFLETRLSEIGANGTTTEKLSEEIKEIKKTIEDSDKIAKELSDKLQEETTKKAELKTKLENVRKIAEIEERIKQLENQKDEIDALSIKLEKSKKARVFSTDIENVKNASERFEKSKSELETASEEFKKIEKELSEIESKSEEISNLEKKNDVDEEKIEALKEKLEQLEKLSNAKERKSKAEKELADFKNKIADDEEKLSTARKNIKKIAKDFNLDDSNTENNLVANLIELKHDLEEKRKEKENLLNALQKIENEQKSLSKLTDTLKEKEKIFDECKKDFDAQKAILEDLENKQKLFEQNHTASILAKALKPGCACPVCGSKEHPELAKESGVSLEDKIAVQKKNLETANKDFSLKNDEFLSAKKDVEAQNNKIAELKSSISEEISETTIEKAIEQTEKEKENAKKDEAAVTEALTNAKNLSSEIELLAKKQSENNEEENRLNTEIEKSDAVIKEQEKAIKGDLNESVEKIEEQIGTLESELDENKATVENFKADLAKATNEKETKKALKEKCETIHSEAKSELDSAENTLKEKISNSEFKNIEEIKSQLLSLEEENSIQKNVSDYHTEYESKNTLLESLKTSESEKELESKLDKVENTISELSTKQSENTEILKKASGELSAKSETLNELKKLNTDRDSVINESAVYIQLSKDLTGDNPKKIMFSSWVLAMYFSEVVEYANDRFEKLSGGRYRFKIEKTRNQGKHGLDIAIEDFSTGQVRDCSTLSGGETFQASISLALALTDVVCNHSGGIRLDSLFIDEGFGTLDQESLDKAIQTLKQIQEQRMVGVISHVEAMEVEIKSHIVAEKNIDSYSAIKIENME